MRVAPFCIVRVTPLGRISSAVTGFRGTHCADRLTAKSSDSSSFFINRIVSEGGAPSGTDPDPHRHRAPTVSPLPARADLSRPGLSRMAEDVRGMLRMRAEVRTRAGLLSGGDVHQLP